MIISWIERKLTNKSVSQIKEIKENKRNILQAGRIFFFLTNCIFAGITTALYTHLHERTAIVAPNGSQDRHKTVITEKSMND